MEIIYSEDKKVLEIAYDISGDFIIPDGVESIGYSAFFGCSSLTSITIPSSVKSIGDNALDGCSSLTSITIPSSVTSIGENAFSECSSLTSITIPSSVTSIGKWAFSHCSSLTSINIPSSVKSIGESAFWECSGLTSINIPSSVKSIGESAFSGCSSLTSITIPSSVPSIGESTFRRCSDLKSITIPSSVTSIGKEAFSECSSLTSITIPSSVTSIGKEAFSDCSGLTSINVEVGNPVYDSREGCNAIIETSLNKLIAGCKNTRILSNVTSIEKGAFSGCSGLASISIHSSVTSIGEEAFSGCSGLTSINVEVENAVYDSREGCNAIIETSSNVLIAGCKNTIIPSSVTSIGEYAFSQCSSLTSITIPSSVTSIGEYAFWCCSGLTAINIPSSVTSIGEHAFSECSSLTSITIPSSVTSIGKGAFSYCSSLTSITIPSSVTSIGESAFSGCSSLTSITIPFSVKIIGGYAFMDCRELTSITIPSSVTSIGKWAFRDCSGLKSIKVFGDLEDIGKDAFYGCKDCTLYVPSGMKSKYKNHPEFSMFKDIVEIEAENESDNTYYDNPTSDIQTTKSADYKKQYQESNMENTYLPNGTTLKGSYRIIRFIAAGGFGCTYEAEHIMLGKRVAIKEFFIADFCDRNVSTSQISVAKSSRLALVAKLKQKFLDEARAIASMRHTNIVSVSDVFEEYGTAYYVMDYIDGKSLAQLVRERGALPEQEAVKYITQVAHALEYVHSLNRLHLDIKPANIMLRNDGSTMLIDFGVSKQYDEVGGENTSTLLGYSNGYAPVEQMSGQVQIFTPSTDIYALGATLYTLLSGIVPLDARARAFKDVIIPLPSTVSATVREAVRKAMNIDGEGRTQSVREFLQAIKLGAINQPPINGNAKDQYDKAVQYCTKNEFGKAIPILLHLAEQGYAPAQNTIGGMYENGWGVPQDYRTAFGWYYKAAVQGYDRAQYNLGLCYADGKGTKSDLTNAIVWFAKAAEQGHLDAQTNLAAFYHEQGDYAQSLKWGTKAAEQGDVDSQYGLGIIYMEGEIVDQDLDVAIKWFKRAQESGIEKTKIDEVSNFLYQNGLALYHDGANLNAVMLWEPAAELGNASAQYQLGLCYEKGEVVYQNQEKANQLFHKAAAQGHDLAKEHLGIGGREVYGGSSSGCFSILISAFSLITMLCMLFIFLLNAVT